MSTRICPVCRTGRILRRDIKTCGAPECVALWRTLSVSQRAQLIDKAAEIEIQAFPSMLGYGTAERRALIDTSSRDDEALKVLFGEDAPGQSKKGDKND